MPEGPRGVARALAARLGRVRALPSWQAPRRARNGRLEHRLRVALGSGGTRRGPELPPGAARSGIARGPVPSRPVLPGPHPYPHWEGRSTARAPTLERANAAPDRYVEVTTSLAAPLVTTGRSPREVPSICRTIVGGGTARWQAATALRPRWTAVRRGPRICAMARVTYESKTMQATSSGWPATAATPSESTPPAAASTRGSSPWRAARSTMVSLPTVTRLPMR
jgi:hypothetical protein